MSVNAHNTSARLHEGRFLFATRYALKHLGISAAVALLSTAVVFGLLYPPPYRTMLGVGTIFMLVLLVDVVCGPSLTLVLASPRKSRRERWLDFSLIGIIQLLALLYGLHSVWIGRPVVLAFEVDRLVVATANEVESSKLGLAPPGLRRLPWWGVLKVGTRRPSNNKEMFESLELSGAGISPAHMPNWWTPWEQAQEEMKQRAHPVSDLLARRPADAGILKQAIQASGLRTEDLRYLPLTSNVTMDWIVLLDEELNLVGYAPVDGF